jgi:hypothetical protein
MNNKTINQLRHFAYRFYRYQLDDSLASLEPHTQATVADLANALTDEDSDVRLLSLQICGRLGEKAEAALPAMTEALADERRLVRIAALEPVAMFGSKAIALPCLLAKDGRVLCQVANLAGVVARGQTRITLRTPRPRVFQPLLAVFSAPAPSHGSRRALRPRISARAIPGHRGTCRPGRTTRRTSTPRRGLRWPTPDRFDRARSPA